MEIIELCFRGHSVFMSKNELIELVDDDWFLSTLLTTNFQKFCRTNNENDNENDTDKIVLNEDKNTAMSLIDTLRYNTLIVLPNVSLDYMLALSEKWCLPDDLNRMIKDKIQLDNYNNNHPPKLIDKLFFKCINCETGFKLSNNQFNSCLFHSKVYNQQAQEYLCCGKDRTFLGCRRGYHAINHYDLHQILQYDKKENE